MKVPKSMIQTLMDFKLEKFLIKDDEIWPGPIKVYSSKDLTEEQKKEVELSVAWHSGPRDIKYFSFDEAFNEVG